MCPIDIILKTDQVNIQFEGSLEEFQASRYENDLQGENSEP